jgi:hypothetical protein
VKSWAPPASWTAWPMRASQVPKDIFMPGKPNEDDIYTFRRHGAVTAWGQLEDILSGTILRSAEERFSKRNFHPEESQQRGTNREQKADFQDPDDASTIEVESGGEEGDETESEPATEEDDDDETGDDVEVKKRDETDAARTDTEADEAENSDATSRRNTHEHLLHMDDYRPVLSADDDISYSLLRPHSRHIISKLDDLLTILHNNRVNEATHLKLQPRGTETGTPLKDNPDEVPVFSSRKVPRWHHKAHEAPRKLVPHYLLGMVTQDCRDWSHILGAAALAGFSEAVIARTAERCRSLFGQDMALLSMEEQPTDVRAIDKAGGEEVEEPRASWHRPVSVEPARQQMQRLPLFGRVSLGRIGRRYVCTIAKCRREKGSKGFSDRESFLKHLKDQHGENTAQLFISKDVDDLELDGAVHEDGFLQPFSVMYNDLGLKSSRGVSSSDDTENEDSSVPNRKGKGKAKAKRPAPSALKGPKSGTFKPTISPHPPVGNFGGSTGLSTLAGRSSASEKASTVLSEVDKGTGKPINLTPSEPKASTQQPFHQSLASRPQTAAFGNSSASSAPADQHRNESIPPNVANPFGGSSSVMPIDPALLAMDRERSIPTISSQQRNNPVALGAPPTFRVPSPLPAQPRPRFKTKYPPAPEAQEQAQNRPTPGQISFYTRPVAAPVPAAIPPPDAELCTTKFVARFKGDPTLRAQMRQAERQEKLARKTSEPRGRQQKPRPSLRALRPAPAKQSSHLETTPPTLTASSSTYGPLRRPDQGPPNIAPIPPPPLLPPHTAPSLGFERPRETQEVLISPSAAAEQGKAQDQGHRVVHHIGQDSSPPVEESQDTRHNAPQPPLSVAFSEEATRQKMSVQAFLMHPKDPQEKTS